MAGEELLPAISDILVCSYPARRIPYADMRLHHDYKSAHLGVVVVALMRQRLKSVADGSHRSSHGSTKPTAPVTTTLHRPLRQKVPENLTSR